MRSSTSLEEATAKVEAQFALDHAECLASVYGVASQQLETKVAAVLKFFLGGAIGIKHWGTLKEEERKRPWYYTAYR